MNPESLAREFEPKIIEARRLFHKNPELSGKETGTARRLRALLDEAGVAWRPCGKSLPGTLAEVRGGRPGATFMLRADMDALPVLEKTGLPFASRNTGIMHACGHDCHMAMLYGAALMAQAIAPELPGTIRFIFQPSEENGAGAPDMIADGAMEGVDAMFGMHVWPDLPAGQVSVEKGGRMASVDRFKITVEGVGGHAAMPHLCKDPAPAVAAIVTALQTVVSREMGPLENALLTVGTITSGTRWNVIAGSGEVTGTVRTFSESARQTIEKSMRRIAADTARAFGCRATVAYDRLSDPVINDEAMAGVARKALEKVPGLAAASYPPTLVGEDFGFYCTQAPAAFAFFGVADPASKTPAHPLHSDLCAPYEPALVKGALLHLATALEYLEAKAA